MPAKASTNKKKARSRIEEHLRRHTRMGILNRIEDKVVSLDPSLRREMELILQTRLPDLRLHIGERSQQMAEALGARAFAIGERDVFFGKGEFKPFAPEGKGLLAHELFHLVEGSGGLKRRHDIASEHDEIQARAIEEMVFAQEKERRAWRPEESLEPQTVVLDTPRGHEGQQTTKTFVTIDKNALEEKIMEVIEKEIKRAKERRGER